jgi:hypothetical protein
MLLVDTFHLLKSHSSSKIQFKDPLDLVLQPMLAVLIPVIKGLLSSRGFTHSAWTHKRTWKFSDKKKKRERSIPPPSSHNWTYKGFGFF